MLCRHAQQIRDDELRHAAALYCLEQTPKSQRIPILNVEGLFGQPCDVGPWLEKYRPEVVIGVTAQVWWDIKQAGWRVPEDVAFINLHKEEPERYHENEAMAGMVDQTAAEVPLALELLDQEVRLRYRGITHSPRTVLLHPRWVDAASLPPRSSLAQAKGR